jgi:hypothetical protein
MDNLYFSGGGWLMFRRIGFTFSLMRTSWNVLMKDKELLLFSLLSMLCCGVVIASFAVPMFATGYADPPPESAEAGRKVVYYLLLFLFYFCNYFVVIFFNSAIISCAVVRMRGGNPTVGDGIRAAMSRLPLIAGWALVSATVGLILRIIESRSEKVGQIVAGLLGTAWSIVTYLAVPVLVVENTSPIDTFKRSASLLKETWGEQLVAGFSFGVVFFLLAIPGFIIGGLGFAAGGTTGLVAGIAIAVIYLVMLGLIHSALQAIFQAALYLYAAEGTAGELFDESQLRGAVDQR